MAINPIALTIRTKKLGALIRDARLTARKSLAECALSIGVTEASFEAFELGNQAPSLPQVELIAYFLDIPLEHFWGSKSLSAGNGDRAKPKSEQIIALRQRIIGVLLRKARLQAGLSLETLAEQANSSPAVLESYELGELPIPLPDLEIMAGLLHSPLDDFQDQHGFVGNWASQQRHIRDFTALSSELQEFVSKPVNRPYLELAQRLSEMSVEKLRAVAEILLEITL